MGGSTTNQWKDALLFGRFFSFFKTATETKNPSQAGGRDELWWRGTGREKRSKWNEWTAGASQPQRDRGRAMDPVAVESRRGMVGEFGGWQDGGVIFLIFIAGLWVFF